MNCYNKPGNSKYEKRIEIMKNSLFNNKGKNLFLRKPITGLHSHSLPITVHIICAQNYLPNNLLVFCCLAEKVMRNSQNFWPSMRKNVTFFSGVIDIRE